MIPIITIIIIVIVAIIALPAIIQVAVAFGTQLYDLYERSDNIGKQVEKTVEHTLEQTNKMCSIIYDDIFELFVDQMDNPRIKSAKVIYDKVGYLDECRTDELISYLNDEQRKKFDRFEVWCNLNSCAKAAYDQFK